MMAEILTWKAAVLVFATLALAGAIVLEYVTRLTRSRPEDRVDRTLTELQGMCAVVLTTICGVLLTQVDESTVQIILTLLILFLSSHWLIANLPKG
jgi:hypothetical protein